MPLILPLGKNDINPLTLARGNGTAPSDPLWITAFEHFTAGELDICDQLCRACLKEDSANAGELHLSSIVASDTGDYPRATLLLERAIILPDCDAECFNTLGELCRRSLDYPRALALYEHAMCSNPSIVTAKFNLGLALLAIGRFEDSIAHFDALLGFAPFLAETHLALGVACFELGDVDRAIDNFTVAHSLSPYDAHTHNNLGVALKGRGENARALFHLQTALRLSPHDRCVKASLVACVSDLPLIHIGTALRNDLLALLSEEVLDTQDLAYPLTCLLKASLTYGRLQSLLKEHGRLALSSEEVLNCLCTDDLLLALLKNTIFRDASIERVLTTVRRLFLTCAVEANIAPSVERRLLPFMCALARQCYANEYVYSVSQDERGQLEDLKLKVTRSCENSADDVESAFHASLLGSYGSLARMLPQPSMAVLVQRYSADEEMRQLLSLYFADGREEELKGEICRIGSVHDSNSAQVRQQYEESPYPRWLRVNTEAGQSLPRTVRKLFPWLDRGLFENCTAPDVLIAGCGTGQHAIRRACELEASDVLGVDFSLASLAYAIRRARELKVNNVEFKHCDVLDVALIRKQFDLIEGIGLLHHMYDPVAGMRSLSSCLKAGGMLRIGVYSRRARRHIAEAQQYISDKGYSATPDGIRDGREDILSSCETARFASILKVVDFYTLSDVRDLLFNVHEARFDLLELSEMLEELGLRFRGFEFTRGGDVKKYRARFPDDPSMVSLRNWDAYEKENQDAFIGLYVMWLQKE